MSWFTNLMAGAERDALEWLAANKEAHPDWCDSVLFHSSQLCNCKDVTPPV